jgi:hypothetical protein
MGDTLALQMAGLNESGGYNLCTPNNYCNMGPYTSLVVGSSTGRLASGDLTTATTSSATPEPASILLSATGIAVLGLMSLRRRPASL